MYLDISISLEKKTISHDTLTLCPVHKIWYTMSIHNFAVICSQKITQGQVKISLRSLFFHLRLEERVRSRGLKKKSVKSQVHLPAFPFSLTLAALR